jgi:hypothetical protein
MEKFVREANIANYIKQLKTETDSAKQELLQKLLAEEQAKPEAKQPTASVR